MKAILIKEGLKYEVELKEDTKERLNQMRELVECESLDVSYISDQYVAWVDDEGLLNPEPNIETLVYVHNNQVAYGSQLAGNILITGHDGSGETLGLTKEQLKDVKMNLRIVI